jgi:hypothetical protein
LGKKVFHSKSQVCITPVITQVKVFLSVTPACQEFFSEGFPTLQKYGGQASRDVKSESFIQTLAKTMRGNSGQ